MSSYLMFCYLPTTTCFSPTPTSFSISSLHLANSGVLSFSLFLPDSHSHTHTHGIELSRCSVSSSHFVHAPHLQHPSRAAKAWAAPRRGATCQDKTGLCTLHVYMGSRVIHRILKYIHIQTHTAMHTLEVHIHKLSENNDCGMLLFECVTIKRA